jgi:hypothetical protein
MDMRKTTTPAGILSIWLLQKQEEEELREISHQTIYTITHTRMYDWKTLSSSVCTYKASPPVLLLPQMLLLINMMSLEKQSQLFFVF